MTTTNTTTTIPIHNNNNNYNYNNNTSSHDLSQLKLNEEISPTAPRPPLTPNILRNREQQV